MWRVGRMVGALMQPPVQSLVSATRQRITVLLAAYAAVVLPVGDVIETGVYQGGTTVLMARLLQNLSYYADRVYYHHADGSYPDFALAMESHGDLTLLREFEDNSDLRELTNDSGADTLNRAQLRVAATADVVVAAQGGGAVLGSLVATQLLILCRAGQECFGRPPDVVWWRRLNNATIETHIDEDVLTQRAVEMLPSTI